MPCSAVGAFLIRPSIVHAEQLPVHPVLNQLIVYDKLAVQTLTSCLAAESLILLSMICSLDAPARQTLARNTGFPAAPLTQIHFCRMSNTFGVATEHILFVSDVLRDALIETDSL